MLSKRGGSQQAKSSKKRSRDKASSEDEDSGEEPCTQFLHEKEDIIKDCLLTLLVHNSTLFPIKKNALFNKFGAKLGPKNRANILRTLQKRLQGIGAFLKAVDGTRLIVVNQVPKNDIAKDEVSPERQLLCLILTLIAVNKGTLKKNELDKCFDKLNISTEVTDPYFGNVSKSLILFEKQCYLKKSFYDIEKTILIYEWGMRAACEVEKDALLLFLKSQVSNGDSFASRINLSMIAPPEDDATSDDD